MHDICWFYRENFGDGEDYRQVRNLVHEYTEIVDYFLKMHTELSNEEIDNCVDSLNSIWYKVLKIGKVNSNYLTRWQCFIIIIKLFPCIKRNFIKIVMKNETSENVHVRNLRGKLIHTISPVISQLL